MKKIYNFILCLLITFNMIFPVKAESSRDYEIQMKQDILTFMLAYPGYIIDLERVGDKVFCIMKSGKKIIYDDKTNKSHDDKLLNPDLQDALEQVYPLDKNNSILSENFDHGRGRPYDLLNESNRFEIRR